MVHIKKLNEMVNLELHSEAENKIRDIARTNTDCFEDCGEGMLSISLFNTNFSIPPRMRLYSYEVMVQVYPNDERDVYVVGYKENGENNWWALNQFTQKEQNDIVDAVQASVNKIKEGGMFSENRRTANARGRAVNEWDETASLTSPKVIEQEDGDVTYSVMKFVEGGVRPHWEECKPITGSGTYNTKQQAIDSIRRERNVTTYRIIEKREVATVIFE